MKLLFFSIAIFWCSTTSSAEDSWQYGNVDNAKHLLQLPKITDKSGSKVAFIRRSGINETTKFFIRMTDKRCISLGKPVLLGDHFIEVEGHRTMLFSGCAGPGVREYSPQSKGIGGTDIISQFLDLNQVRIEEISPYPQWEPLSTLFSAKGFKKLFYEYNLKSAR